MGVKTTTLLDLVKYSCLNSDLETRHRVDGEFHFMFRGQVTYKCYKREGQKKTDTNTSSDDGEYSQIQEEENDPFVLPSDTKSRKEY